jgi:shikimate 5-dehydrogenase
MSADSYSEDWKKCLQYLSETQASEQARAFFLGGGGCCEAVLRGYLKYFEERIGLFQPRKTKTHGAQ